MKMQQSDTFLVTQAQAGDADAFATLIARHYDMVFRLGFRMLGNKVEAQDLAQDVCAGLAVKLAGFRGDAKYTTWLYRVTINAAKDRLRKRTTRQKAQEGWGEVEALSRDANTQQNAQLEWLQQAMKTLSVDLRETVTLVLGEDQTHAEAAQVLGIPEGTVSWRMSEVKKRLRALAQAEERYP